MMELTTQPTRRPRKRWWMQCARPAPETSLPSRARAPGRATPTALPGALRTRCLPARLPARLSARSVAHGRLTQALHTAHRRHPIRDSNWAAAVHSYLHQNEFDGGLAYCRAHACIVEELGPVADFGYTLAEARPQRQGACRRAAAAPATPTPSTSCPPLRCCAAAPAPSAQLAPPAPLAGRPRR